MAVVRFYTKYRKDVSTAVCTLTISENPLFSRLERLGGAVRVGFRGGFRDLLETLQIPWITQSFTRQMSSIQRVEQIYQKFHDMFAPKSVGNPIMASQLSHLTSGFFFQEIPRDRFPGICLSTRLSQLCGLKRLAHNKLSHDRLVTRGVIVKPKACFGNTAHNCWFTVKRFVRSMSINSECMPIQYCICELCTVCTYSRWFYLFKW